MTDFPHGLTGYGLRCRCPECCAAKAEAWARYQPHRKRKPAASQQKRDKARANELQRRSRADKRGFQAECDHPPPYIYHDRRYEKCRECLQLFRRAVDLPAKTELEKAA